MTRWHGGQWWSEWGGAILENAGSSGVGEPRPRPVADRSIPILDSPLATLPCSFLVHPLISLILTSLSLFPSKRVLEKIPEPVSILGLLRYLPFEPPLVPSMHREPRGWFVFPVCSVDEDAQCRGDAADGGVPKDATVIEYQPFARVGGEMEGRSPSGGWWSSGSGGSHGSNRMSWSSRLTVETAAA